MDTNRYHFSNFIDDNLIILAVQAKELLQKNDEIVNTFRMNNEILCSRHSKDVLLFIKENNKSIFSSSSSDENRTSLVKSYQGTSTSIKLTPDACNPDDEEEKEQYRSATLEFSTPIRRQKIKAQPTVKATLNPAMDETGTKDKQFPSLVGSVDRLESPRSAQIAKMTLNLNMATKEFESPQKLIGSSEASSQESPRSAQIAKMTANLAMTEKEFESPKKVVGSIEESKTKSSRSSEISKTTLNLAMAEKDLRSPAKGVGANKRRSGEYSQCAEKSRMSSVTVHDKGSGSLFKDDKMAHSSAADTVSPNPEGNAGESGNLDSHNKYSIGHDEGMKISKPVIIESEIPSPVKRPKICSIPIFDHQEFSSPAENVEMAEKSPEDTELAVRPLPSDELNILPIETTEELSRDDRKRISFSPKKRTKTIFKSIPRVIKMAGKEEINIEVVDLEYGASPTTPRSKSADYPSDLTKGSSIKSPVGGESKTDTSPKTPERSIPSSELDRSGKSKVSSANIETETLSLIEAILEFNKLLDSRYETVKDLFEKFLSFQSSIDFIKRYVFNVSYILMQLDTSGKYSGITEFKETVTDAKNVAVNLIRKLKSWKSDMDFDIDSWQKYFQQIEQLKSQYEPFFTNEGKPAVTFEVLQVYEREMRAIWKKMGDMALLGGSRRSLFSYIASDIEKLIKMLVKTLILVGILQPR